MRYGDIHRIRDRTSYFLGNFTSFLKLNSNHQKKLLGNNGKMKFSGLVVSKMWTAGLDSFQSRDMTIISSSTLKFPENLSVLLTFNHRAVAEEERAMSNQHSHGT